MSRMNKKYFYSYDPEKDQCVVCGKSPTASRNFCVSCYQKVQARKLLNETRLDVIIDKLSQQGRKRIFAEYDSDADTCVICGESPTYAKNMCRNHYEHVRRAGQVGNTDLADLMEKVFPERLDPDFKEKQKVIDTSPRLWPDFGDDGDPYVLHEDED